MHLFSSMKIEVWSDGRFDGDMMSIRAEMPDNQEGLRHIWFVLTSKELRALVSGERTTAEDGYHKVVVHGDRWFFYDMEGMTTRLKSGNITVPFYNASLPRTFMKAVLRLCWKTWRRLAAGRIEAEKAGISKHDLPHRIEIEVSQKHRDRSSRLYGQGLGQVEIDCGDYKSEDTQTFLNACLENGGETFARCLQGVINIARNSTWGFHQRAKVRISKDLDGFNWTALTPGGRMIVCGGIVNHSRDKGHDWSTHT